MSTLFFRTLSQGLQAFAPVAVALVWCTHAGDLRRTVLIRRGAWGAALATVAASWWFQRSPTRALDEAILATLALLIAATSIRALRRTTTDPSPSTRLAPRRFGSVAIATAAAVIVVRQTMEIGAVLSVAAFELRSRDATAVMLAAVGLAAALSLAWMYVGRTATSAIVSTVTTVFATVFACELTVYAVHEWAETGMLIWSDAVHAATESFGPDGIYGVHFSDLLVVAPMAATGWVRMRPRMAALRLSSASPPRRLTAAGLMVLCALFMGVQHTDAPPPRPVVPASAAAIADVVARPHLLFRETAPGPNFGKLAVTPLDELSARLETGTSCQRVSFAGGRGLCLHVDRGVFNTYSALLLNEQLKPGAAIKLEGLPSRTRAAADGRVGAVTVFVVGDGYAAEFSTRTTIVDLATADVIGELEQFTTWRSGERFRAVDFNFWGVTFAGDGNTFYASLRTAGVTYLVRGELALRKLTVLRENVECPSLSPDGRLLAYKKRVGPSPDSWRIHVLDLASNIERIVAGETRYVDDQVEWLDAGHVLYAVPRRTTAISDVWVLPVDGSAAAKIFLPEAESPIVVR